MEAILEVKEVSKTFGEFVALNKVSFDIPKGKIFGIAGPNGAGKTTLFNVITGNPYRPSSGEIIYNHEEIQNLKPYSIVHKGIARTFQIPVIYKSFSYIKSIMVGSIYGNITNLKQNVFGYDRHLYEQKALDALEFVGLINKKDELALRALLYDLKLLMIASALATDPRLLLLDEPVSGLTETEIEQIIDIIYKIHEEFGVTICIIEHIMKFLMNLSDEVMILNYGEIICRGNPKEVANNSEVIKCYLGEEYQQILETIEGG